jgi:hypothetical protein
MLKIDWIITALGTFFNYFGRFLYWIDSKIGVDIIVATLVKVRSISYIGLLALFFTLGLALVTVTVAFTYFFFSSVIQSYNIINHLIDIINNPSQGGVSSPLLSLIFTFLNFSGISQGLRAVAPFIYSALLFRLMKALYTVMIRMLYIFAWIYKTAWELSRQATDIDILHPQITRASSGALPKP